MSVYVPRMCRENSDCVNLNGFSISIRDIRFIKDSPTTVQQQPVLKTVGGDGTGVENHYYMLQDGTEYAIWMHNARGTRAQVDVTIDGEAVGTWILNAGASCNLQRPQAVDRRFTFVADASSAASAVGVVANKKENGLVSIKFTPERKSERADIFRNAGSRGGIINESGSSRDSIDDSDDDIGNGVDEVGYVHEKKKSVSMRGAKSGATILGSASRQTFGTTTSITHVDHSNITTITVRLLVAAPAPKFVSLASLNSQPKSTSIPPPIHAQQ